MRVAVIVALAGGAAAALPPLYSRLLYVAAPLRIALLIGPDPRRARARPRPAELARGAVDLAHLAAAAVWLGGLVSLVFVVPSATSEAAERSRTSRRFSKAALIAVAVLARPGSDAR